MGQFRESWEGEHIGGVEGDQGPEGEEDVMNSAEQLREEVRAETRVALRAAITRVLGARTLSLSELGRTRLASCVDVATLTLWLERAATATTEAEVFASESAPLTSGAR